MKRVLALALVVVVVAAFVAIALLFDAEGRLVQTWIGRTDFQSEAVSAVIDAALVS